MVQGSRSWLYWLRPISAILVPFLTGANKKLSAVFTVDMINIFNHVEFVDPVLSLQTPASFGVLTTQYGTPRAIQLSLRLEF